MNEIKIDKNVPLPNGLGKYCKWPFGEMKIGDSFEVDADQGYTIRTSASYYAKRHEGFRFSIRRHGKAYRCWRVPKQHILK